jgi:hypothetical protein
MNENFFKRRKKYLDNSGWHDPWFVWWKGRYSNDIRFFWHHFMKLKDDFQKDIPLTSYYRRVRPPTSPRRQKLEIDHLLSRIGNNPYNELMSRARGEQKIKKVKSR